MRSVELAEAGGQVLERVRPLLSAPSASAMICTLWQWHARSDTDLHARNLIRHGCRLLAADQAALPIPTARIAKAKRDAHRWRYVQHSLPHQYWLQSLL
jgi:hypothetical protein